MRGWFLKDGRAVQAEKSNRDEGDAGARIEAALRLPPCLQYSDFNWSFTRLQLGLGLCEEVVSCKDPLGRADISVCKHPRGSISIYIILSFTEGLLVTRQKSLAPPPLRLPRCEVVSAGGVVQGICRYTEYTLLLSQHPCHIHSWAQLSFDELGCLKKGGVN